MWIVRLALRRPYTTAVMCFVVLLMGVLSVQRMLVDIFPSIDIPVVAVVWTYNGLSPEEMERRVVTVSERSMSTAVNGISRIESQSIQGVGVLRVYFQPGTNLGGAIAQIQSVSGTILRMLPPGITPPLVVQSNAGSVPVVQLTASSKSLPEEKISDFAGNFVRMRLFTIPGLSTPFPYGGKTRQVSVDLNLAKLAARGLSPADVMNALASQNVITPAGVARVGGQELPVTINSSPRTIGAFENLPIKVVNEAPVLLGDVATVADGFSDQTNIVRVDGRRAVYLAILKKADASTLAVVDAAKDILPIIQATAPKGLELRFDFDQSHFVRAAIQDVVKEAMAAALLVSVMILLFLGSWRSMLIVCTSIPLAILVGLIGLKLAGQSLNLMTLGGLSLAIGMLVDDATVEVENIHRNLTMGKPLTVAILDGAQQIAVPAIVATLAICIVFFPVVLLVGPAKYLFTPLAMAVVFSMLASYLLSRTLVPTLARMLMGRDHPEPGSFVDRFNNKRERWLKRVQDGYGRILEQVLHHPKFVLAIGLTFVLASAGLLLSIGQDFFPSVDVGLMKLHVRAPAGTRLEETEKLTEKVEALIRKEIPKDQLETINSNIGQIFYVNMAFTPSDNVTSQDAEISISLKSKHTPVSAHMSRLRKSLLKAFPDVEFYFQPADIVSQVLNFGASAPIDVQIEGPNLNSDSALAVRLQEDIRRIPGAADVHIKQVVSAPAYEVVVDRLRAAKAGLTQRDVATGLLTALSGNGQLSPSYYLNPDNGVSYNVAVKAPLTQVDSPGRILSTPFSLPGGSSLLQTDLTKGSNPYLEQAGYEPLGNLATIHRIGLPSEISHYTVQRVIDVMANVEGRDLGSVVKDIQKEVRSLGKLPPGTFIRIRGQSEVMFESFKSLSGGLLIAIALVYLLMVTLFQSWIDPLIIVTALPGAFAGILWGLAVTGTTLNVESLMGSIMAIGIATSNAILIVSFANQIRVANPELSASQAALEAGKARLRPVVMTALAMILGMVPMALALGEAGSQNAPLGRAVIGGLIMATVFTLFIVPVIYSLLRQPPPRAHLLESRFQEEQEGSES